MSASRSVHLLYSPGNALENTQPVLRVPVKIFTSLSLIPPLGPFIKHRFLRVKRLGFAAGHPFASGAEFKNRWIYISTSSICLHVLML
jgi:hypothetical protein